MHVSWTSLLLLVIMLERTHSAARVPNNSADTPLTSNPNHEGGAGASQQRTYLQQWPDDVQLGCQELRAKRFISDGFCTSLKPIKEVVCAGFCMPIKEKNLPWWSEFTKYWARPKLREWRCVEAVVKLKKVQLMCENGETRTYKIKIVKSCRCKSYENTHNITGQKPRRAKGGGGSDGGVKKRLSKEERRRRRKQEKRRLRLEKRREKQRRRLAKRQKKADSLRDSSVSLGNSNSTLVV